MDTNLRNQRIDKVIASIRGEVTRTKNVGFQMSTFITQNFHPGCVKVNLDMTDRVCGTVACIAGHAFILSGGSKQPNLDNIIPRARGYLGLSNRDAHDLFFGRYSDEAIRRVRAYKPLDLGKVKPEQAIQVLEHLKTTNTVDWLIIL